MRYQSQNVLSVLMKCLVMTDEVVVDLTWSAQVVLRSPVRVKMQLSAASLLQNISHKLFKLDVVCSLKRSVTRTAVFSI